MHVMHLANKSEIRWDEVKLQLHVMTAMIWQCLLIAAGLLSANASPALVIDSIDVEVGSTSTSCCQPVRQGRQQICAEMS